jgi:hypothetical protein
MSIGKEHIHTLHVLAPMLIGIGITVFSFIEHYILKDKLAIIDKTFPPDIATQIKNYIYGAVKFVTFFWSTVVFWINIVLNLLLSQFAGSIINTIYVVCGIIFIFWSSAVFYTVSSKKLDILVDHIDNADRKLLVYQIIYNIIPLLAVIILIILLH